MISISTSCLKQGYVQWPFKSKNNLSTFFCSLLWSLIARKKSQAKIPLIRHWGFFTLNCIFPIREWGTRNSQHLTKKCHTLIVSTEMVYIHTHFHINCISGIVSAFKKKQHTFIVIHSQCYIFKIWRFHSLCFGNAISRYVLLIFATFIFVARFMYSLKHVLQNFFILGYICCSIISVFATYNFVTWFL